MVDPTVFHPHARELYDYWTRIHPAHGLPGREHFEPMDVAHLLPYVRLVDVQRDPILRFRYRLLGSLVDAVHGRALTGRWMDEAFAGEAGLAALLATYRHVVDTVAPLWRRGAPIVVPEPECAELEALRLPLATDGKTVDMILCIHLYFDARGDLLGILSNRPLGY